MKAAFVLGAHGVQLGTRFAATSESSASLAYKKVLLNAQISDTAIFNMDHMPIRAIKNRYVEEFIKLEKKGASIEHRMEFRGKMRSKEGIFNGNTETGELEAGQVCGRITEIVTAKEVVTNIVAEMLSL
jgi:enoyl-[acyl-carrier protein] reductase II